MRKYNSTRNIDAYLLTCFQYHETVAWGFSSFECAVCMKCRKRTTRTTIAISYVNLQHYSTVKLAECGI